MTTEAPARPLQASIDIAAPATTVWGVVSDVRRTGEWSPECRRVVPIGTVRAGTWMLGLNHRKAMRWATLSRIVQFSPGQEIAWHVLTNGSTWTYRLEPADAGTRLTQTRETPNGVSSIARWFTRTFLGGERGHDSELEAGMATGLGRIKALIEG